MVERKSLLFLNFIIKRFCAETNCCLLITEIDGWVWNSISSLELLNETSFKFFNGHLLNNIFFKRILKLLSWEIALENKFVYKLFKGISLDFLNLSVINVAILVICFEVINAFVIKILTCDEFKTVFNWIEVCLL